MPALALDAGRRAARCPRSLNAANEVAVAAFLDGRARFDDIPRVVEQVMTAHVSGAGRLARGRRGCGRMGASRGRERSSGDVWRAACSLASGTFISETRSADACSRFGAARDRPAGASSRSPYSWSCTRCGHFLAARAFGVKVHEFMVGLPGPALRLHTKNMDWGVTAVPLGGYVRIAGMEPGAEDELLGEALVAVRDRGPLDAAALAADARRARSPCRCHPGHACRLEGDLCRRRRSLHAHR